MQILVLGGTQFLGRHVTHAALERGHEVTLFNRGKTLPELFPEAEKLHGDRDGNLEALAGRSFDAVFDTSGFVPRIVAETIDALGPVGHYTFVSSVSVYRDDARAVGEEGALAELTEPTEEVTGESYGPLKALCEESVRRRFPDAFVPRPGLIVGPWDHTGRFTYWPTRLAEGGRVLAPAPPGAPLQVIDVRDCAAWFVEAAETTLGGTFNTVSPTRTIGEVLETCRTVVGAGAELVWVDPAFLAASDVSPWHELPLWLGADDDGSFMRAPVERALAAGLRIRPLEETVRSTLDWAGGGAAPPGLAVGLDRAKEQRVLEAWDEYEAGA